MSAFISAKDARIGARKDLEMFDEIRTIERAILVACYDGVLSTTISDTMMTSGETGLTYFSVWQGLTDSREITLNQETVLKYFTDAGYSISRKVNPTTQNTFMWVILW